MNEPTHAMQDTWTCIETHFPYSVFCIIVILYATSCQYACCAVVHGLDDLLTEVAPAEFTNAGSGARTQDGLSK